MLKRMFGSPSLARVAIMKGRPTLGNAARKSRKRALPLLLSRATSITFPSTASTLLSIDRPGRNPCCSGEIHGAMHRSSWYRTALASTLLSPLATLSGLVASGLHPTPSLFGIGTPSFGMKTISELLNSG